MPGSFKLPIPISSLPDMMGSLKFTQSLEFCKERKELKKFLLGCIDLCNF